MLLEKKETLRRNMIKMKLILESEDLPAEEDILNVLDITKYSKHDSSYQQQYITDS